MKQLFWISLLLTHLPGTESNDAADSCLSQPNKVIWHQIGQNTVLPCSFTPQCSLPGLGYAWFVFKADSHYRLEMTGRYSMKGAALHIHSLNTSDSGIYHCAVESQLTSCCQQHVGNGTTLVVKKKIKVMVRNILLWISFALLLIYSLAIVTLIIMKKYGRNMKTSTKMSRLETNKPRKNSQFRNVLQELHSRGNLKKSIQTRGGNGFQVEAASDTCNISSEDIYQNI